MESRNTVDYLTLNMRGLNNVTFIISELSNENVEVEGRLRFFLSEVKSITKYPEFLDTANGMHFDFVSKLPTLHRIHQFHREVKKHC